MEEKIEKVLEALDALKREALKNNLDVSELQKVNVAIYYTEHIHTENVSRIAA